MPVNGLPLMLEIIMNKFLEESSLSSYKIAGNNNRSTLVLRFETTMADTDTGCVSDIYHSTPASSSYRRKAPSHIERDRRRHQHYWQSKPVYVEPPTQVQTGCLTNNNVNDKSTMTVTEVSTRREYDSGSVIETMLHNSSNYVPDNVIHNRSDAVRKSDQLTPISSPSSKSKQLDSITATSTQEVVSIGAVAHNTADQRDSDSNTSDSDDTPVQTSTHNRGKNDNSTPRKKHRRNKSATIRNSTTTQHNTTNECSSSDKTSGSSDETSSDEDTDLRRGAHTSKCSSEKNDFTNLSNKFLDHDKLSISDERQNITKEMKRQITRHDRNNKFLKLMPRSDGQSEYVLGETDDLIIEYNRSTEKIRHFVLKTIKPTTSYQTRCQRQARERGDETTFLLEEGIGDAVQRLKTALPLLKKWIHRHVTTTTIE